MPISWNSFFLVFSSELLLFYHSNVFFSEICPVHSQTAGIRQRQIHDLIMAWDSLVFISASLSWQIWNCRSQGTNILDFFTKGEHPQWFPDIKIILRVMWGSEYCLVYIAFAFPYHTHLFLNILTNVKHRIKSPSSILVLQNVCILCV